MSVPEIRLSAFGEVRVVEPETLFDYSSPFGLDADVWGTQVVGGGTVVNVTAQSAFRVGVGTGATDSAKARTHERFRYQAGRGQRWRMTGYAGSVGASGRSTAWGYFHDTDGHGFEILDGVLYVFKRTSTGVGASVVRVPQTAWNVDPMTGAGPSGKTLDVTRGHIYEGRFAWLGVGPLTLFVDGHPVHTFDHGNDQLAAGSANGGSAPAPWMRRANLPLSVEIANAGAAASGDAFTVICCSVASEGGSDGHGEAFAYASGPIDIDSSPTERAIFAVRVAAAFGGDSDHGVQAIPMMLSASGEGGRAAVKLIWNPTLTFAGSPAWAAVAADSAVEVLANAQAEATVPRIDTWTGGRLLYRAMLGGDTNASLPSLDLRPIFHQLGRKLRRRAFGAPSDSTPTGNDVLLVVIERLSGTVAARACLAWEETR